MNAKNQYSFQRYFLLEFTRNLIENTTTSEVLKLKRKLKEKEALFRKPSEEAEKSVIQDIIQAKERELFIIREQSRKPVQKFNEIERPARKIIPQRTFLRIPEPRLPQNLQYLKPSPVENVSIDLGNLNPFIKDPAVEIIECSGADKEIIVKGRMGTKPTEIKLSSVEIDDVINKFSEESKIPVNEGFYKVALGKLIFSAIISKVLGSKFVITKMLQPVPQNNEPQKKAIPNPIKF